MNFLDLFFIGVSFLGSELFLLITLPIIYFINRKVGFRLSVIVLSGIWLTHLLKAIFKIPRPPPETWKVEASGYSFPSGHSTNAASYWGFLGYKLRKIPIAVGLSVLLILLIGYSRVYLRVHRWEDVIVGWIIGLSMIALVEYSARLLEEGKKLPLILSLSLGASVPFILIGVTFLVTQGFTSELEVTIKTMSTLSGIIVGYLIADSKNLHLEDTLNPCDIALRSIIGLVLIMILYGIYKALKAIAVTIFVAYWLMGIIITLVTPYIVRKIK